MVITLHLQGLSSVQYELGGGGGGGQLSEYANIMGIWGFS